MIGADKFLHFLQPPCSLEDTIPTTAWIILGVSQIAGGILIWIPKLRKLVVGFFVLYMLFFIGLHIGKGTSDIEGAVFMAVLLGILLWNPSFIRANKS